MYLLATIRWAFTYTVPIFLLLAVILHSTLSGLAQVMSSTNYQIQSDSVNFGGGLSTSTSYRQESTFGELATGPSDSASFSLRAGYQQMQETFIGLTLSSNSIDLNESLEGAFNAGTSTGQTSVVVTTDSLAGYSLTIEAGNSPAMNSGANSIPDFDPGATPDFYFTTAATDAHFGFSPEGPDIIDRFKDDGVDTCGAGGFDTEDACWDGLSMVGQEIASGNGANHPDGATTTLKFRVALGAESSIVSGMYVATTTVTAVPL